MKKIKKIILVVVILLMGCNGNQTSIVTKGKVGVSPEPDETLAISTPSVRPKITLSDAPGKTNTQLPFPTPTLFPTPTKSIIIRECAEIKKPEYLKSIVDTGTVVVDERTGKTPLLIDLETHVERSFPVISSENNIYGISISPDKTKLFYLEYSPDLERSIITVIDRDGIVLGRFAEPEGAMMHRWLNNDLIEANSFLEPGRVFLIDSVGGTWVIKRPSFHDLLNTDFTHPNWLVQYSADLKWVAYLDNGPGATIWDNVNEKSLWKRSSAFQREPYAVFNLSPQWSPDSNQVAIYVSGEFYRINRTGEAYPLPDLGDSFTSILGMSWSPDGKSMALWNKVGDGTSARLLFLDTHTNQIHDICVKTDNFSGVPTIWSPDGDKLLVEISGRKSDGSNDIFSILINRSTNQITELLDNLGFLGWMR